MTNSSNAPIDKGFAWVVLLSCSVTRMLVSGFYPCIGNFYVEWQIRFDTSATRIAWIGFAFMLFLYPTGPIAAALTHKFTYKSVTIFSGVLTSVSLFALSFATELWHIYMIIPFCGMGMGMAAQHGCVFYVYYFDKRYALATTLNGAAGGIALFILPPLIETLNNIYGLKGALQISSALMLNMCVCGMFARQPKWEIHRTSQNEQTIDQEEKFKNLNNMEIEDKKLSVSQGGDSPGILKGILNDITECFDLSLFLKVRFLFQGVLTPFMFSGAIVVLIYMVPYGVGIGLSALKSSFLVSVVGICMTCARLFPFGLMVDKKIISPSVLGGVATIFGGLTTMAFPFTTTYIQMVLITIVFGGAIIGIGGSMYPVLIRDAAGSSKKATGALAYSNLLYGIGGVSGNLLTGFLRDLTDSYTPAYILAGIGFICMGLSMLSDPYLIKWQARIDKRKNKRRYGHKLQV